MDKPQRLYPIGEQDFPTIRKSGRLYIDKTDLIYRMTHSSAKYMFLSRPRRFGKSLLVSTLRAYFEGRQELFKGLAINTLEREWESYPVILLDISLAKHEESEDLNEYLLDIIRKNERRLDIQNEGNSPNIRLSNLIEGASEKTGKQVVVLIDEYDSPLLDVMHEEENLPKLRQVMRNFYSPLKACSPYLRYVFLTGITKFSQLSIFSELNNIENISMDESYAALCGITKEEMLTQMSEDIDSLAERLGITREEAVSRLGVSREEVVSRLGVSREEVVSRLTEYYDGYHFTWPSPDVFNPFSLLMAMEKGKIDSYWFGSGTPTYLIEMMRKFDALPSKLAPIESGQEDFDAPTETMASITPLLYQAGYLTIKGCDSGVYTLDYPNREIETGLMKTLLPQYIKTPTTSGNVVAIKMRGMICKGDMDGALRLLQEFFETIPYTANASSEGHWQQVLIIIFRMLGFPSEVELHSKAGRIDIELRSGCVVYVIEIKTNASARAAMRQIDQKAYAAKYSLDEVQVVKVGVNFDSAQHTITEWTIENT